MATAPSYDVVFDFDGVLADSAPLIVAILDRLLRVERGYPLSDEELRRAVGPPFRSAVASLCAATGADLADTEVEGVVAAFRAEYAERVVHETPIFPGVAEAVAQLGAAHRLTICSSKPRPLIDAILAHWDADGWFADVEAPATDRHEPKATGLARLLGRLPAPADRAALVGDTRFDAEAARAVGTAFVGAGWGIAPAAELHAAGAIAVAEHPADLPAVIAELIG